MEKTAIDKFMMYLPIIILVAIIIVVIIKFIKKKYNPKSEIITLKEIKTYYGHSLKLIWNNRIIIYIPLISISAVLILGIIGQFKFYRYLVEDNFKDVSFNIFSFNLISCLDYAISSLNYAIKQVFTSNSVFILLSAILIFFYPRLLEILRKSHIGQRFPEYRLFKKVIILNLFIAVFHSFLYTLLLKPYQAITPGILKELLSITIELLMTFFILSNYSFIISILLQLILDKINRVKRDRGGYLEIAINKFPRMFSFNILLFLVIPFIINLPEVFFESSININLILYNLTRLIWLMFLTAPFIIMTKPIRFSEVLEKSLALLFRNFRLLLFILSGLFGGAVLYFIASIITNLWRFLLLSRLMAGLRPIFTIIYSMIFMVAFFMFLKDEVGKE